MVVVIMHEARTRLSELVHMVEAGERVVVARNGTPVVERTPAERSRKRQGGFLEGQIWISPDFDEPNPELEKLLLRVRLLLDTHVRSERSREAIRRTEITRDPLVQQYEVATMPA
jgi:prevent-host-death family protein